MLLETLNKLFNKVAYLYGMLLVFIFKMLLAFMLLTFVGHLELQGLGMLVFVVSSGVAVIHYLGIFEGGDDHE